MQTLLLIIVIFLSAFIQGMTSFGSNMIALPLFKLVLPFNVVVPTLVTFNLIMNSFIFKKVKQKINLKYFLPLFLSGIFFTIVGSFYLNRNYERPIEIIVGVILILFGIVQYFEIRIKINNPHRYFIPIGFLSGILNGIASLSGPPVLIFLSNMNIDKSLFRATLSTYFLCLNIVSISMYLYRGMYNMSILYNIILLFPFLYLGLKLGIKVSDKVNDAVFKKIVSITISIMGLLMLIV